MGKQDQTDGGDQNPDKFERQGPKPLERDSVILKEDNIAEKRE